MIIKPIKIEYYYIHNFYDYVLSGICKVKGKPYYFIVAIDCDTRGLSSEYNHNDMTIYGIYKLPNSLMARLEFDDEVFNNTVNSNWNRKYFTNPKKKLHQDFYKEFFPNRNKFYENPENYGELVAYGTIYSKPKPIKIKMHNKKNLIVENSCYY